MALRRLVADRSPPDFLHYAFKKSELDGSEGFAPFFIGRRRPRRPFLCPNPGPLTLFDLALLRALPAARAALSAGTDSSSSRAAVRPCTRRVAALAGSDRVFPLA